MPVFRREDGAAAFTGVEGPLIIETPETTVVVGPGSTAVSDTEGNLRIAIRSRQQSELQLEEKGARA